jgi:hypothetical protein
MIFAPFLECGFLEAKWSRLVPAAAFVNDILTLIGVNPIFILAFAATMALTALALPGTM